jgi:glycosyltransferase involved in cell wall biosynthesis
LLKKQYFSLIAKRLKKFETSYYNKFDAIAAITPQDAKRLQDLGVNKPLIEVIPAGVILDKFEFQPTHQPKPNTIFSISALDWMPNQEALDWFLTRVWPQLSLQVPNLEFHIAGKSMPKRLIELNKPNVLIHGTVPSAVDFINAYDIMVVPLLSGGGMRVKIIEAMALGKCIVSSPIGAEGIAYTDTKNIFICNTPEEWVNTVINCLQNPVNKASIASEALLLAQKYYDNRKVTAQYEALFNKLLTK